MAMTGTVKFFNGERGYGFIKPDDGGRDVFVHITAVERAGLKSLMEGQRITFEVIARELCRRIPRPLDFIYGCGNDDSAFVPRVAVRAQGADCDLALGF